MRNTRQKDAIYRTVAATKCHPDAEWIYGRAREIVPNISLGTVYRNLKSLTESGRLETVESTDRVIHYDADTSPHAHCVCTRCGKISDCPSLPPPELDFEVQKQKTVFYGICKECLGKTSSDN